MAISNEPLVEGGRITKQHYESKLHTNEEGYPIITVIGSARPELKYSYVRMKDEEGNEIMVWAEQRKYRRR